MEANSQNPTQEFTVFYAWQSDAPSRDNRNFIESALDRAFKDLHKSGRIESSPRIDKDTKGVPGIPDIANTIFEKIRNADAFVADISFVAETKGSGSKWIPNPNVMLELGYALSSLGWERIALVMNTGSGSPEDLPFDLRNRRWPIAYELSPGADDATRSEEKRKLKAQLEEAITAIAGLPARQKPSTTSQRLDALETMVSSLNGAVSQYTNLANMISGLQKVAPGPTAEVLDPKSECQKQLNDFIARLLSGNFHNVAVEDGLLAIAIRPSSRSTLQIFGENESMLNSKLRPLSASGWSYRIFGERFVTLSGSTTPFDGATELTVNGEINAASHDAVSVRRDVYEFSGQKAPSDAHGIPSVAYEKRIIEAVHSYITALKSLGAKGPWCVGLGIINLKKSFLYVDARFAFGGRYFEGDKILPGVIEISDDVALENPQAIARSLRPAFDYIWREHGYPRSLNYAESGDWIGR